VWVLRVDETADAGRDIGTTDADRYSAKNSGFSDTIEWGKIDIDAAAADQDHLISPEERRRIAMGLPVAEPMFAV
jgi:hypothetical protein